MVGGRKLNLNQARMYPDNPASGWVKSAAMVGGARVGDRTAGYVQPKKKPVVPNFSKCVWVPTEFEERVGVA